MPASIAVEERLFSLVLALMATESGLTKGDILSTVQGYSARFAESGLTSALDRQFERDKDELRDLGIPLQTIDSPDRPGDNTALRYLIPKGRYDLPADIEFSPRELGLLALAAAVWREGSLSADSRRALMKLKARGIEASEPLLGYAPTIRVRDASFDPLQKAQGVAAVSFPYLKPGEHEPRVRTVVPLAIVQHDGRWHLHAHDIDASATRTFLLSRIVGPVTPRPDRGSGLLPMDTVGAADHAAAELRQLFDSNEAELVVQPGTDAAVRLAHRSRRPMSADGVIVLGYTDTDILADELVGFGPEVEVRSPDRLRRAVSARLARVLALHADAGGRESDRG
ncbi:helix-turn-helix transcriptional regulator [Glaciibacter flavus]|nr:WYL domain-containing protein [Glaciibacter flavus]